MIPFVSPATGKPLNSEGQSLTSNEGETFPVVNGIPRFTERDNYANAFGHQWKSFPKIQLDSYNGSHISGERLERCLGHPLAALKGMELLEVGCGAGRFTEHFIRGGAHVHAVDLSEAVEVNQQNADGYQHYCVAQANVYNLPFSNYSFDLVVCLGVIQHTPSPEHTITSLWQMVKPGGRLVIDHYTFDWMYYLKPVLLYRYFLKRMNPVRSKKIVQRLVNFFFPLHWKFRNNNLVRMALNRISPCYIYFKQFPGMDREFHYQLASLDTYDGLTDYYKHLRSQKEIQHLLSDWVLLRLKFGKAEMVWRQGV